MSTREIPFGFIKDDKIYLKSWGAYPDREIGLIKDSDETSIEYFTMRFDELSKKIDELDEAIQQTENKGSFLMKLRHLKDAIPTHSGLGDYQSLSEKLNKWEGELLSMIEGNRERNTEIKKAMIEEAGEIVKIVNWRESTEKIHDIKSRWIKTGNAVEDENQQLDEAFWEIISDFFDRKKSFYEDKKRLASTYRETYEQLIAEAKRLDQFPGKDRFDMIRTLKERWKETGNIPKEEYDVLRNQFNSLLKRPHSTTRPPINLNGLIYQLEQFFSRTQKYDYRELERIKKDLSQFKPPTPELRNIRREALQLIGVISERDFIEKLASKRFPEFRSMDQDKKKSIKLGILKELLSRDRDDLAKFEANSANFSMASGEMGQLVNKKLHQQRNKISTKERLLKHLQEG